MQLTVRTCIIYRGSDKYTIGLLKLRGSFVYNVVEYAFAVRAAEVASYTTPYILIAYIKALNFNTVLLKSLLRFPETSVRTSVDMRTAVYYQYFHSQ